jgi:serine/threonine protein kinase
VTGLRLKGNYAQRKGRQLCHPNPNLPAIRRSLNQQAHFMDDLSAWLRVNLPGNYSFENCCGTGGMGVVFRVKHNDWGLPLAVKVPKRSRDRKDAELFRQEAEVWADIGLHPYVATLFYVRELDSRLCTFSEFVEIGGLDGVLRKGEHRGTDNEITLSRILSFAASTAWGLDAAHRAGLVHCDFKPGNVLVESNSTAKVTDFGLARRCDSGGFACPGGTPLYASPEQVRCEELTSATDFWSWAATCFEMFIGGPNWQSGAAVGAAFHEYLESGAKFPGFPQMPDAFAKTLGACFATKFSDRPDSFREIAEAICEMHFHLLGEPCPASPPDMGLVAADSLNNRAVSLLDLGEIPRASALLREALALDQYHPEAIFNYHAIIQGKEPSSLSVAEKTLKESAALDSFNPIPWILLARLASHLGRQEDANRYLRSATERGGSDNAAETIPAIRRIVPVLANPMSGDDLAFHKDRFYRLIAKAKNALTTHDTDNASRYVLMAGDIPGFARHPDLHRLRAVLNP